MLRRLAALLLLCACQTRRPMLVAPHAEAPSRALLFEGVRVFDGSDALTPESDVLVVGGRIAAIALTGRLGDPRAAGAERVDGRGRTLLPGLVDCHVHLGGGDGGPPWSAKRPNTDAQSAALVYAGVTTILAASADADYADLQERIASGELAGPRIFASSRIFTAPGGHPVPMYKAFVPWPASWFVLRSRVAQVEDPQSARRAVDEEIADRDPAFVKIVYDDIPPGAPRLDRATLEAIVGETRARGRRASVHIGSPQEALDAVSAGAALLMHVPGDEPLTEEQARTLAASGVPMVTTARIYAVLDAANRGTLSFTALEREVMPPGAAEDFARKPEGFALAGFPPGYFDSLHERDGNIARNLKVLAASGARLIAGTDSGLPAVFHGAALHRELQALVALGFPPARALRMATVDAARVLDPQADYGAVAPGLRADLLLVDGDPLADISATGRIAGVWQDGRRADRARPR